MACLVRPGVPLATFTCAGFAPWFCRTPVSPCRNVKRIWLQARNADGEMNLDDNIRPRTPWFARKRQPNAMRRLLAAGCQRPVVARADSARLAGHLVLRRSPGEGGASGNAEGRFIRCLASIIDPALARFSRRHLFRPPPSTTIRSSCSTISGAASPSLRGCRAGMKKARNRPDAGRECPRQIAAAQNAQSVPEQAGLETRCGGIHYSPAGLPSAAARAAELFAQAANPGITC